jgi:hypothetical protein
LANDFFDVEFLVSELEPSSPELMHAETVRPVAIQHAYVSDADASARLEWSLVLQTFLRPKTIASLLGLVFVLVVIGVFAAGDRYPAYMGAWIGFGIGLIALSIAMITGWRAIRRRVATILEPGFEFGSGFGPIAMAFRTPTGSTEVLYSAYESAQEHQGFAYLRMRSSRLYTVLPMELFPDDTFAMVQERIAAS